jgi:uncharacterized protein
MSAGDWKELYQAAEDGNFGLLEFHVKNGTNVNYQHPEILMTVLVTAIKNGHTSIAIYLLRNGADPNLESHFDQLTPLAAAVQYKNPVVLAELDLLGIRQNWFKKIVSKISSAFQIR